MGLLSQLHIFLSSKTSITSLASTRIYQSHLPQSYLDFSLPAISMTKISETHFHNLSTSSGVAQARVQFDIWGNDEDAVEDLGEALRLVLQSYSGLIGSITCLGITLDDVNSLPEPPVDGSNQWIQHYAMDFIISYRNAVAPN